NQIVMDDVMHELVFGMENVGMKTADMRRKTAEMTHVFGMGPWLAKQTHELSGGQKQQLNLASVLLLQPKVLLLDEPTAQLDPMAAKEFMQLLHRLNDEYGITVIMAEHRLEEVMPICDRVIVMDQGEIRHEGTPRQV